MTIKRVLTITLLIIVSTMFITIISAQDGPTPTGGQPWDLRYKSQEGLFVFFDSPAGASITGKPVDVGDFDADGCGDIAVTGQNNSFPLNGLWRGSGGHIRIIMNVCDIGGRIVMDDVEPGQGVITIYGAYSGDMAGTETYVSDFNGDGYDDLLFGAQNGDGPNQNRSNAGTAYILFGGEDFAGHEDIDLLQPQEDIIVFHGATYEDRLGLWVEGGDFDNDGFHDALIAANQADGIGDHSINTGEVWIIYGTENMIADYGLIVDLREAPEDATRIIGVNYDDLLGSCVWGDDLNGDGYDDAIVSAALWRASSGLGGLSFGGSNGPANRRYNGGEAIIIFGKPELRGQTILLEELVDEEGAPVDDSITVIYGTDSNDLLGEEIATGDMDGDGRNDLVLGTLVGDGAANNQDEAGEAWVIYTYDPIEGQMIDLADPEPGRTVVIYPDQVDSKAGDTLRVADINNDGIEDLFYGAPDYDPIGYNGYIRHNAGILAILMGQEGGFPNDDGRIMIFDPPEGLEILYVIGGDDNDMMPYAMDVYDVDGDGVVDIIPNAMGGDGANNDQHNAGEIYIIDGAELLSDDHIYVVISDGTNIEPTATEVVVVSDTTATPLPEATISASGEGDVMSGQPYYEETCAGCHGFNGEGIDALGLPLVTSPLVLYANDDDLLDFLRDGRETDDPDNVTGVAMPASGGRPDWDDFIFYDIIAYMRWLRDNAQQP